MPANGILYNNALLQALKNNLSVEEDEIEVLLVDKDYTFDPSHEFVSDITNELENASGTGYERKVANNVTLSLVAGNKVKADCDNITYTAINTTEDARAAVFYQKNNDDNDSVLVCYLQGIELSTNGSDIEVRIDDDGIFEIENEIPE